MPGFISISVYDLLIPGQRRNFSDEVLRAVGFSCLNFAALSWIIIPIHQEHFHAQHPVLYLVLFFLVLFVAPASWPIIVLRLVSRPPLSRWVVQPVQKARDWVFMQKRRSQWVIVHLKDGRAIGGKYGRESYASSYPAEEQIYLEEVWKLSAEGQFLQRVEHSSGMVVLGSEIIAVEFFE